MKVRKIYTETEISKMILMYNSGISLFKIREILKMDKNNIKKILIENNIWIEGRDKKKKISDYTYSEINNIISLYQSGMSSTSISIKLNIVRCVIKKILIKNHVWVESRDDVKIKFSESDKTKILNLYVNENKSTHEIAKVFGISNIPIKRILINNNALRKGWSNGIKIILTQEQENKICDLYQNKYKSCDEIGKIFNCSGGFIEKYLSKNNLLRNKSEGVSIGLVKRTGINYDEYLKNLPEYEKYKLCVIKLTNRQSINLLENYEKRGTSGTNGAYHLDHKYSIFEGFKNNVKPEIIASLKNLVFIPWRDNVVKRTKCSITKEELIKF
jgi:transposase